jgi:hypothetical protein
MRKKTISNQMVIPNLLRLDLVASHDNSGFGRDENAMELILIIYTTRVNRILRLK